MTRALCGDGSCSLSSFFPTGVDVLGRFGVMTVWCDRSLGVFVCWFFQFVCFGLVFLFEVQHVTFRHIVVQLDLQFSLGEIKTVYTPNEVLACIFFA